MMRVWPRGWVCQAVRAPGSKVTWDPTTRAGSGAWKRGSMRTEPVNQSAGPLPEGCEPARLISMWGLYDLVTRADTLGEVDCDDLVQGDGGDLEGDEVLVAGEVRFGSGDQEVDLLCGAAVGDSYADFLCGDGNDL